MFYEDVLRALQKHKVRYLILGGAAVNLHGVPRMTGDLDIAIDMSKENVYALVDALEGVGMKPVVPVDPRDLADPDLRKQWREEKNMKALTFQSMDTSAPYREIDIVLENPFGFKSMYEARLQLQAQDLVVDVVSLKDLIKIKEEIGREQDLADVESLRKADGERRKEQ